MEDEMSLKDLMTQEEREAGAEAVAKIEDLANAATKLGEAVGVCLGTTEALEAKIKELALAGAQLGAFLEQTTLYAQTLEKRIEGLESRRALNLERVADATRRLMFAETERAQLERRIEALEANQAPKVDG